ncbi:cytochrome c [bacterium]|nr:cytochrome c [bacterium]
MAGCISARTGEPGPLTPDSAVERGREVFMRHCDRCHPGGDAGIGPALNSKSLPGFVIKSQVRLGLGAMPRFSGSEVSSAQLNDIVKFLKAQRRRGPG